MGPELSALGSTPPRARREALTRALGIVLRTVFAWQRKKARALGGRRSRTAAVTFVQRFSSALRLNVHFHCLVPDGVFAAEPDPVTARSRFLRLAAPTDEEVDAINAGAARKIIAALRAGLGSGYFCDKHDNDSVPEFKAWEKEAKARSAAKKAAKGDGQGEESKGSLTGGVMA